MKVGLTLSDLQDEVYTSLGMTQDDVPLSKVTQMLNRSFWEVSKKLKFREQDDEFIITLTPNQTNYNYTSYVSDFDAIRHVVIQDTPQSATTWNIVEQTDYENLMNERDDINYTFAMPTKYARFGNEIVFNWLPGSAYTVKVSYKKSLGNILAGGPPVPEEWHEVISYGATWRLWIMMGMPMRASSVRQIQTDIISTMVETETKEDRDYAYSGAALVRRRYP